VQKIKAKDVLVYTTMPRIFPRVKGLFSSGFSFVAFLMAHIYYMVRLLPQYHPYLASENIGRFGVSHVVTEASRSLKFSRKNIDQLVVYFAMLMGIILIVAQFILFVYAMAISPAMAFSWFDTVNPQTDVAFSLLDRVFGVPNLFCSFDGLSCTDYSVDTNEDGIPGPPMPLPFHVALHGLFRFYSTGLLLIALLIFLYFVVVIILETATSGTPFGQRFQNVWVPIRLVVALGLLMPINFGLSSGQYIVLYAAKYGSSFATNGWREFNDTIQTHSMFSSSDANPAGERYSLVAIPEAPDITPVLQAMSVVHACAYSYHRLVPGNDNRTRGTGTYPDKFADYTDDSTVDGGNYRVTPYLVKTPISGMTTAELGSGSGVFGVPDSRIHIQNRGDVPYLEALGFFYGSDIVIRFGEYKRDSVGNAVYDQDTGNVKSLCGDVRISVKDLSDPTGAAATPNSRGGSSQMLAYYYDLVLKLWFEEVQMRQFARVYVEHSSDQSGEALERICSGGFSESTGAAQPLYDPSVLGFHSFSGDCEDKPPTPRWKEELVVAETTNLQTEVRLAWGNYILNSTYGDLSDLTLDRGWGGAGIWYNKIAEINGAWMDGVRGVPYLEKSPYIIEEILSAKQQTNENTDALNCAFTLKGEENAAPQVKQVGGDLEGAEKIGPPICKVSKYWTGDDMAYANINRPKWDNPFQDGMNLLIGATGLISMRGANMHVHPMAQLVAVGKGLVDSAVINMAGSTSTAFLGGMFGALSEETKGLGKFLDAASSIFFSMAFMGLTVGFTLFYVLPFLPFIYFYFAVASWVKAIFEAMVGVPLWALAHLRIDGEGLPGDAAQNGYFLILEIFVRPILTVFGLLAAILIFSTQVRVLNVIWELVTANAAGFGSRPDILGMGHAQDLLVERGIVDKFFFTIIYTIVCYMLALSSFKLIDKIPDNILRWAGAGVSSFGDIDQDQVDSINRYASMGALTVGQQGAQAMNTASGGLGRTLGSELAKVNKPAETGEVLPVNVKPTN